MRRSVKLIKAIVRRCGRKTACLDSRHHGNERRIELALKNSREAWSSGRKGESLDELRRALLMAPGRADLWLLYAQRSTECGRSDVAWEAIKSALETSPGLFGALELHAELVRVTGRDERLIWDAVRAMSNVLPSMPQKSREALDFLLPLEMDDVLMGLSSSEDEVVRDVIWLYRQAQLSRGRSTPGGPGSLKSPSTLSRAIYELGVGDTSAAVSACLSLPLPSVPINAVRRAMRRSVSSGDHQGTLKLAAIYLTARPTDAWAIKVQSCSENRLEGDYPPLASTSLLSNSAVSHKGFPFRALAANRAYDPSPRRILYLLHSSLPYSSAGYATRSHGLISALSQTWNVSAITRPGFPFDISGHRELLSVPRDETVDSVHYHRLSTLPGKWPKDPITRYVEMYSTEVRRLAAIERPVLIHAASNHLNGLAAVEAARALGIPSIYEVRGLWEITRASRDPKWRLSADFRRISRMEADAARAATRVVTLTAGLRDELIDRGVPKEKILIVPNGVDSQRFKPSPPDRALSHRLGLDGKIVIGYVGSLLDYEGLDLLIRAAHVLWRERHDFHVLLVGDGAEKANYEELARGLGVLGSIVTFVGRVDHEDVGKYYSLIDISPFPRLPVEVCELVSPLKPFEAMAMGKAVIASDVRALAEVVSDGRNGLLHEKGSVEDLVRTLRLLMEDKDLRGRLGRDARDWVVAHRDWRRLADDMSAIYETLL